MTEAQPDSPKPPPLPATRSRWRRTRLYFWAILLCLSFWFLGAAFALRHNPRGLIAHTLAVLPFPSTIGHARWTDRHTLVIIDIKLGDFFYASSIVVEATLTDLLRHHVTSLTVNEPELFMGALNRQMTGNAKHSAGLDWTISKLIINRGTVLIDLGPNMPAIPVRVGALRPVIINYLKLQKPDDSRQMTEERVIELENIHFSSPFDPLAPVLTLPVVRLRFTYDEIWHHQIREVDLVQPNLFLGQDLFWFTDQFKKARATAAPTGPESPWKVGLFEVRYGQLTVNVFGRPQLHFPFFFDTTVGNIRLDQLDKISAKSALVIRHFTKDYPEYKVHIENLQGRLEFSLPPTSATANNVVPTLYVDELAWNGIAVTQAYCTATFDPTGIYMKLGGVCEKGLMEGNFEIYYNQGFKWNADFFANSIDCRPIAEKLAGKYCSLTGTLDGRIAVQGLATDIQHCSGTLRLDKPGLLQIRSVDELLGRIPADMVVVKKDAIKIALQAFAEYPYTMGKLRLNYAPGNGEASLNLAGPYGKRDFSVYWHPFATSEVAKAVDNH